MLVEWCNPTEIRVVHTFLLDLFQPLRLGHLVALTSYQAQVHWKTPNYLVADSTCWPVSQFPNACTNYCHFECGDWDKRPGYNWNQSLQKLFSFQPFDGKWVQLIKPVHPKRNPECSLEALILWPCDAKSQLIGKDPGAGKDWGQEEKGMTKDEMAGWHHWLNGHEFEQALGGSGRQGGLACCSLWGFKESDMI